MDEISYNVDNSNANDQWENAGNTGEIVERINKDNLVYVTKPGCKHPNVRRDETENDFVSFLCPDCHLGWLFKSPS